jgi:streptogramin lyase
VGGQEATRDINITLVNEKPIMKTVTSEIYARAPNIDERQAPPVENMGNRRYRIVVEAVPDNGVDAVVEFNAVEKYGQDITVTADLDNDGNADGAPIAGVGGTASGEFRTTFRDLPEGGRTFEGRVTVSDGNDTDTKIVRVYVPAISAEAANNIRYTIDVGNDGSYEVVDSRSSSAEFRLPPGTNTVAVSGSVSANGQSIPFNLGAVDMPNERPRFNNPRLVSQEGFDVVVAASATDRDGDPVTISVDWGDGNISRGRNVIYRHSYANARFQVYNVRLRATDDRGLFDEHTLTVDIVRPAIKEADVASLAWERVTEAEGTHDGVRGFAIDAAGTLFSHNYNGLVRRSADGGDTWVDLLEDIECCGAIATRNAGEIFIGSPSGLYFSSDNGDNWALFDESKYVGVAVSPDQNYVVAATKAELKRFDMTGRPIDTYRFAGGFEDIESCGPTGRSAFSTQKGQMFINDRRDMNPAGWRIPEARFGKDKGASSVSFDKACNLYQGVWNGFRKLNADNSIEPTSVKVPKHLFHVSGSHTKNVYGGVGDINDILSWPDGAVIIGAERGLWAENEPWNAYRTPYWKKRDRGLDRSKTIRRLAMHPTNGYAYAAASSAVQMPKYCRKARRGRNNRRGRRGRRARVSFYYTFCGFTQNYQGGVYRSDNPLLLSRTVGDGGSGFDERYARGVAFDGNAGGLVVQVNEDQPTYLWLVDTAASTMTKWDPNVRPPLKMAEYRVGIPAGECPGTCCHEDGCNMPSRVAIDSAGNTYVASRGFGMQGTVTKIAGAFEDCIDRNNNGRIDTSRDGTAMDYGADECILWTAPVGPVDAVLRAMTVDLGNDQTPDGFVWVGSYNRSEVYKLDPSNGRTIETLAVGLAPYGMTIVSNGDLYVSSLGDGALVRIDTTTNQVAENIANPADLRGGGSGSYGITTDTRGRIWQNSWGANIDAIGYDPADGSWCRVTFPAIDGVASAGRGITVDPAGRIWTALGGDGPSYLAWWDPNTCEAGQSVQVPRDNVYRAGDGLTGASAIGADSRGKIWLAHKSVREMIRVDPDNNFDITRHETGALVYSYSDFTGVVRRLASGQGSYEHDFEAECDNPTWTALDWQARAPAGSSVNFSIQTAARRNKLHEGQLVNAGRTPGDVGPINISGRLNGANVESRRFLRIKATLSLGDGNRSPILQGFTVRWACE